MLKELNTPNIIPSHWLVVSFKNSIDETALWMSCPNIEDQLCKKARIKIKELMLTIPSENIGLRYKLHMKRAKRDGVPGA